MGVSCNFSLKQIHWLHCTVLLLVSVPRGPRGTIFWPLVFPEATSRQLSWPRCVTPCSESRWDFKFWEPRMRQLDITNGWSCGDLETLSCSCSIGLVWILLDIQWHIIILYIYNYYIYIYALIWMVIISTFKNHSSLWMVSSIQWWGNTTPYEVERWGIIRTVLEIIQA